MKPVGRLRSALLALATSSSAACAGGENDNDDGPAATEGIGAPGEDSSGDPTAGDDDDDDAQDTGMAGSDTGSSGDVDSTGPATTGAGGCDLEPLPSTSFATDIYEPIISVRCSCHVVGAPNGLAMPDAMTAQTNLIDAMAMSELALVTPGDRDMSYLWAKVTGVQDAVEGGGGGMMPLGDTMPCNEIVAIGAWIDGGAPP